MTPVGKIPFPKLSSLDSPCRNQVFHTCVSTLMHAHICVSTSLDVVRGPLSLLPSFPVGVLALQTYAIVSGFKEVLGTQTQVLTFIQEAFYPLTNLPKPNLLLLGSVSRLSAL